MWTYLIIFPIGFFAFILAVELPVNNLRRQLAQFESDAMAFDFLSHLSKEGGQISIASANDSAARFTLINQSKSALELQWEINAELVLPLTLLENKILKSTGFSKVERIYSPTVVYFDWWSIAAKELECSAIYLQSISSVGAAFMNYLEKHSEQQAVARFYAGHFYAPADFGYELNFTVDRDSPRSQINQLCSAIASIAQENFTPDKNIFNAISQGYQVKLDFGASEVNYIVLSYVSDLYGSQLDSKSLWQSLEVLHQQAQNYGQKLNLYWYILRDEAQLVYFENLTAQYRNNQQGLNLNIIMTDSNSFYSEDLFYYMARVLRRERLLL